MLRYEIRTRLAGSRVAGDLADEKALSAPGISPEIRELPGTRPVAVHRLQSAAGGGALDLDEAVKGYAYLRHEWLSRHGLVAAGPIALRKPQEWSATGGGASVGCDDRVRWQSQKPTSRTQPRTHPRGQPGRCAGSSSRASRWTAPSRRARNVSGTPTRDAGWEAVPRQRPTEDLRIAQERRARRKAPFPPWGNGRIVRGRKSRISTGLCDSVEFSATLRHTPPRFFDTSPYPSK